jgi:hypothetical protein
LPNAKLRFIADSVRVPRLPPFVEDGVEVNMTTRSGLPNPFEPDDLSGVSDHLPLLFDVEVGS